MKASFPFWTVGVSLLVFTGCASTHSNSAKTFTGNSFVDTASDRDKVLVEYRTALSDLRHSQLDEAKKLLDDALLSVGGIIGPNKSAQQSRRLFNAEEKKTFIGEPYERVMAYYYRGILYWMDGEPDNARACFRNAQFQDSDAENKEYSSDYVLLDYLDGLASTKLSADGSDAFKRAQAAAKNVTLPPYDAKANVLIFVDYGAGPVKYASGQYGEELRFRLPNSFVRSATVTIGDQTLRAAPYDDLYFQATTRGGRVMDHVLAHKTVFKSSTSAAGDVGIVSGAVLASQQGRHSSADEVGLGLLAAGIISKIFSSATTPAADTRSWDNLPQYLSFVSTTLPPGQHVAKVEFNDAQGKVLPNLTKTVTINIPVGSRDSVIYVSDKSTT